MADLYINNRFALSSQGSVVSGKQGLPASGDNDDYAVTVSGKTHRLSGSAARNTATVLYDNDNDGPATFTNLYLWVDQDCVLQIVGPSSNVILPVKAYQPFTLSGGTILAAANTTPIAGTEPTLGVIDNFILGYYDSDSEAEDVNYICTVIL